MLRFSSHLEMNYDATVTFPDRWLTAYELGFEACEFVWRTHDVTEVIELQSKAPLHVSCLGGTTGFECGGNRPLLTNPADRDRLAADVENAVRYAKKISCHTLIMVPGNKIPGWSEEKHRQEAILSLKNIAPIVEKEGITVVLEPLNSKTDHVGIYCDTSTEAFRIVESVGSSHIKILYDVYHMQIMEGNVIDTIRNNHSLIGYYHLAKVPGRFEPVGGELNFLEILDAISQTKYEKFVGLEYKPGQDYLTALKQIKKEYPSFFKG